MVGPGPTDPRDQVEPSAGRKSAAPNARQESDPLAAVLVLHKAANVTSRRQHRGPRPAFPCPKYGPVLYVSKARFQKATDAGGGHRGKWPTRSAVLEPCVAPSLAK